MGEGRELGKNVADALAETQAGEVLAESADTLASPGPGGAPAIELRPPIASLAAGEIVGRYVVRKQIGVGGMGIVYEAYDPELNRDIALKLLRADRGGIGGNEASQTRLLREAQAMARLSHVNVITVHDVGTVADQVFVAMELIRGVPLSTWMQRRDHSWQEVVRVFCMAGRGLQAAHEAGIVHRDFKPDNVLFGDQQELRVLDFGLAGPTGPTTTSIIESAEAEGKTLSQSGSKRATRARESVLTQTGMVMGTPAYMSPEQHRGQSADATSDQFSFCVALYEGLYGERPFEGDSILELASAVESGRIRPAPEKALVPRSLRSVLLRGLSPRPGDRYSSMSDLLAALTARVDAKRRHRSWMAVAFVVCVGAGAGIFSYMGEAATRDACAERGDELDGVWNNETRAGIRKRFEESKRPYATQAFESVSTHFDRYAVAWKLKSREVCEATKVKHEQSDSLFDLRMRCLEEKRATWAATTSLLASSTDPLLVDNAVQNALDLPSLDACDDVDALSMRVPAPEDQRVRERVKSVSERVAGAAALRAAGKSQAALEQLDDLYQEALSIDYSPLLANLLYERALCQHSMGSFEAAETSLREAARVGALAKDDVLVAQSLSELVSVLGSQGRIQEAIGLGTSAETSIVRAGDSKTLRATLYRHYGEVLRQDGKHQEAIDYYKQALTLWKSQYGDAHLGTGVLRAGLGTCLWSNGDFEASRVERLAVLQMMETTLGEQHTEVARALNDLGDSIYSLGKHDEALAMYQRALAIWEQNLGRDNIKAATALNNIGIAHKNAGRLDEAAAIYARALSIREAALGSEHPLVADSLANMGSLEKRRGNLVEARKFYERALRIRLKVYGPEHKNVAQSYLDLGGLAEEESDFSGAIEHYNAAIRIQEKVLGRNHPRLALTYLSLAHVHDATKNYAASVVGYQQVIEIWERTLGPQHPNLAYALIGLGSGYLETNRSQEAVPILERAVALYDGDPALMAPLRFYLARALWQSGSDRPRALKMARASLPFFEKMGAPGARDLKEVQEWIANKSRSR